MQGCYHHARRYVKGFEAKDEELASYLLERFRRLDEFEWEAFTAPVTQKKIDHAREMAKAVWADIKDVAETVIALKRHSEAKNHHWKKGSKVYKGCHYIVKHFDVLTLYLTEKFLVGNNTFIERALRPQKRIMDAVPVRKSESSQCGFDINRTIAASCECAGLSFKSYLQELMQIPRELIEANPEKYTPYQMPLSKI
jgi:hypothetical protein